MFLLSNAHENVGSIRTGPFPLLLMDTCLVIGLHGRFECMCGGKEVGDGEHRDKRGAQLNGFSEDSWVISRFGGLKQAQR